MKFLSRLLVTGVIALTFSACSDDKQDTKSSSEKAPVKETISHKLLNAKVSDNEKQDFEKAFAAQCVARELKNSTNPEYDKKRVSEACECVGTFLMKNLTAVEAEKFMVEHQNSQSLTIKYENAAYHCLQQKAPHQTPHINVEHQ